MTTAEQAPPRAPARLREFSAVAASGACVAFVIMGMVQAFYGPAIPALRTHFHISPSIVGTALTAHFTGALLGVVVSFCYRKVLSDRWSLACSYALMAAGAAGFALAPWWPGALASAFVLGLGFGGLDYGLNRMFASGFGTASPAMLNLLNAFFGVGAILGPALIGWLSPQRYAVAFGGCGLVCAILVGSAAGKRDPARSNAGDDTGERQASRAALRRETPAMRSADASPQIALRRSVGIVAAFVVIYVLHVAIETGVGAWEPTHLVSLGRTPQAAATATALYWLTMTAGRFACIALSVRWPAGRIVTLSCLAMAAALAPGRGARPDGLRVRCGRPGDRPDLSDRPHLAEAGRARKRDRQRLRDRRGHGGRDRVSAVARRRHSSRWGKGSAVGALPARDMLPGRGLFDHSPGHGQAAKTSDSGRLLTTRPLGAGSRRPRSTIRAANSISRSNSPAHWSMACR